MRRALVCAVAVSAVAVGGLRARAVNGPSTTPAGYAVLGLEDVTLREGVRVEAGDVGANVGTVILGRGVMVAGSVAADTIRLVRSARAGQLFCVVIEGPRKFSCQTVSVPIIDPANLGLVQVLPGAANIDLRPRQRTAPLPAGSYGTVRVGARAFLVLAGGTYTFESIRLRTRSRLLCAADCRLGVEGRVRLGRAAHVGTTTSEGTVSVRIEVQAHGHEPAVVAGPGSTIDAGVYAPAGGVVLGTAGQFTGSFIGRTVTVGPHAQVSTGRSR